MSTHRYIPEGAVPLVDIAGSAHDCGREYGETVLTRWPGYRRYLDQAWAWRDLSPSVTRLFEARAPHLLDFYRGLTEAAGPPSGAPPPPPSGCSAFAVSGALTLDGQPISGQTKDTAIESAALYIVLRLRMTGAPTILVLCYPGEVLGYGLWSTGMSLFRNALYTEGEAGPGLSMTEFGLLGLAAQSVAEVGELAREYGVADVGNFLFADAAGDSLAVEFSAAGAALVPAEEGLSVHTNHALTETTRRVEASREADLHASSEHRYARLRSLLLAEAGRLTPQSALMMLADHERYPHGLCRHPAAAGEPATTAAVIAEPTRGRLHVVRGNPCGNWPVTYEV
jgi:isopenicillin-N N-acyltransferase-like protein